MYMPKNLKLNWWNVTKKYWKEQLMFYFLTVSSFLANYILDVNILTNISNAFKAGKEIGSVDFSLFGKLIYTFSELKIFIFFAIIYIVVYCLIVIEHIYFGFWFANKISRWVKKRVVKKFFQYQDTYDRGQTLNHLGQDTKNFAEIVVYIPNQIFYMLMGTVFTLVRLKKAGGVVLFGGIGFFLLVSAICLVLNYFLYKRDLLMQKATAKQLKIEDILVNNRDLIIKKNLANEYQKNYRERTNKTYRFVADKDWMTTLAFGVPSYSLITLSDVVFLPFLKNSESFIAIGMVSKLFGQLKKMIDRLRNYPYCFSAQKRLNIFFQGRERDDKQENILITEPIESLNLQKVVFGYEQDKLVLNNLNLQFQKGQLNHLQGENGFGKSTIVNLFVGLYQPQEGEILINNKHKLSEINLLAWREKIAYAEHQNLVKNGLSTGQKQLIDIQATLENSQKEIFIFDEADNALDKKRKKDFQKKLTELSQKKLVILISH